jgi:hypothetical protein
MREQHDPGITDPIVKSDFPFGRLRLEIGRCIADL